MFELLLASYYQSRSILFDGKGIYMNYLFQNYDPFVKQIVMDFPFNEYDSFIFLHAEKKIQNLNVYAKPVNSAEFGLVWNQRDVKIINVILEMNSTNENAKFFIVRRAKYCYVLSSYFDVGNSIIRLDTAFRITSITDSSLAGKYLISQNKPYSKFIRGNAAFSKYGQFTVVPAQFENSCFNCPIASIGNGCQQCASGTIREQDKQCHCIFKNLKYNTFKQDCAGADIISTEPTQTSTQVYFFDCMNRATINVTASFSEVTAKVFSVFKDDACGLNNLQIKYNFTYRSSNTQVSSCAGLSQTMTQNTSFLNITFGIRSNKKKSDRISAFFFTAREDPKEQIKLENIWTQGYIREGGTQRNRTELFHYSVIFHTLDNLKIKMYNISLENYQTFSYWDGTYCSLGIGIATNVEFDLSYLYFGDKYENYQNPLLAINIENSDAPEVLCSSKMNHEIIFVAEMLSVLPKQLKKKYNKINLDEGLKVGGFSGKMTNCSTIMMMSLISLYEGNSYSASIGYGLFAVTFINSSLVINRTVFTGKNLMNGGMAVVMEVLGTDNIIDINAAVNMTGGKTESGIIGIFSAGTANFNVYLNETLDGSSGGLIGLMSAGVVTIQSAFGTVKSLNKEIGKWISGQVDNQICQETSCQLDHPINSWIGAHEVEGECSLEISGNQPIGTPSDSYFFECQSNVKYKVSFRGELAKGNVSLIKSDLSCQLVNIIVRGQIINNGNEKTNISGLVNKAVQNISNITTEINITDNSQNSFAASLIAISQGNAIQPLQIDNILIRGSYTSPAQNQKSSSYVAGILSLQTKVTIYENLSFYGFQITVYKGDSIGFISGEQDAMTNVINMLVDDYNKTAPVANFMLTTPSDEVAFPCIQSGSAGLQLGTRFKNLLQNQNTRKSFIKAMSTLSDSGEIIGYLYSKDVIYSNISIRSDCYGQHQQKSGLLLGFFLIGSVNLNNTYVEGQSMIEGANIIAYPWDTISINMTVQYQFNHEKCAIIGELTGYDVNLRLMVNLTITEKDCGGIYYKHDSKLTVYYASGIIRKVEGSYYVSPNMYQNNCPPEWKCSFSDNETCPANPGGE